MLPLKQQVSSFETQRSGGHRKPDVEICNKYLAINSWGWRWGVEKHPGNISSKSSYVCVCAWMYLLGGFWAEDVCLFCCVPKRHKYHSILFPIPHGRTDSALIGWIVKLNWFLNSSEVINSYHLVHQDSRRCQNCCFFWTRQGCYIRAIIKDTKEGICFQVLAKDALT